MSDAPDRQDMDRALFINLIVMLGTSAMQQLGKTSSPGAKPDEVHLEGAQMSIDMLDMLEAKTKGNLADDEKRILADTLTSLRLSYVEVEERLKAQQTAAPATPPAGSEKTPEESKVKFRKSYGEG
jgi:hypothetical protein